MAELELAARKSQGSGGRIYFRRIRDNTAMAKSHGSSRCLKIIVSLNAKKLTKGYSVKVKISCNPSADLISPHREVQTLLRRSNAVLTQKLEPK